MEKYLIPKPCGMFVIPLVLMTLVSNLSYAENQLEQSGFSPDYDIRILVEPQADVAASFPTAPKVRVIEDIEANYADYITPGLLARWQMLPIPYPDVEFQVLTGRQIFYS